MIHAAGARAQAQGPGPAAVQAGPVQEGPSKDALAAGRRQDDQACPCDPTSFAAFTNPSEALQGPPLRSSREDLVLSFRIKSHDTLRSHDMLQHFGPHMTCRMFAACLASISVLCFVDPPFGPPFSVLWHDVLAPPQETVVITSLPTALQGDSCYYILANSLPTAHWQQACGLFRSCDMLHCFKCHMTCRMSTRPSPPLRNPPLPIARLLADGSWAWGPQWHRVVAHSTLANSSRLPPPPSTYHLRPLPTQVM